MAACYFLFFWYLLWWFYLVGLGARLIKKTINFAMLGWLDRLGGMLLYIIIYTIIFSVILFFAEKAFY